MRKQRQVRELGEQAYVWSFSSHAAFFWMGGHSELLELSSLQILACLGLLYGFLPLLLAC